MQFAVFFLLFLHSAWGVKDYLYKSCDNSGFCFRNRHFANQIKSNDDYESKYSLDFDSLSVSSGQLSATILKELPNDLPAVEFPLAITILEGGSIHVKIDEKRDQKSFSGKIVNYKRYDEAPKWAFKSNSLSSSNSSAVIESKSEDGNAYYQYSFGDYLFKFELDPFKITVSRQNEVQLIVNDQNLLNIEHFRTQSENKNHLAPEESDFDLFSDSFADAKDDTIPIGPESIALDFTFNNYKKVYGIPEHADSLVLKDTTSSDRPYRLYNVDIFEYETDSRMPMYGAIPFMLALKPGSSLGLFWVNSADTFVDIDKTSDAESTKTHWISENGVLEFIIMVGSTANEINKKYGEITGYPQLPQLASLGYHQCRWNYNDEKDVLSINSLMDEHQIPYDYIWLDIEYTDSKKYFTWNKDTFPNPERMLKELDHTDRNLVIIIDPHLKTDYFISNEAISKKITINTFENKPYYGHCWPGESVWIDTLNPLAQQFWDKQFEYSKKNEFMGKLSTNLQIWNDMNEPSDFNGPETSSPRDSLHYGLWEQRSIHNLYGLTYHEATYHAMSKRLETTKRQRPFILTRSYFAGSQRTAAMWTGDNMSKWEYLKISLPMIITSGILGMPFAGADVGGFFGNPSKELLTRWYQTGIWYPFFRAHAHIDSRRREPWVPGEPYTSIIRESIQLRYSLLPVFYTAFYQSSKDGTPVIKPVFYESPEHLENYDVEDQFFIGNSGVLVKPVTEENAQLIDVLIPDLELYYSFDNGNALLNATTVSGPTSVTKSVDLQTIPIFLKGGSIIATKSRHRRSSKLMFHDPFTLTVALDKNGNAKGKLYMDDGESFDFENSGEFLDIEFEVSNDSKSITSRVISSPNILAKELADVVFEKIVILSDGFLQDYESASVQQNNEKKSISVKTEGKLITLVNPKISVISNWVLKFGEEDIKLDQVNEESDLHDEL